MKLGLFVPTLNKDYNKVSASIWIRVYQMIKHYESFGIKVYINNPFIKYDIVIFYRWSNSTSLNIIKYLKKISKKVYWDTCVNYYELHSNTNQKQVDITKEISSIVDGVIVSTDEISKRAKKFNNVFIMDDPIDFEHFKYKKEFINFDNPIFGWSGISSKAVFLNKYKYDIKNLNVISDKKPSIELDYKFYKWRYESFPYLISKIDIALLPREFEDDPYNIGHSSFKALVFAAQGVPIIANKLPSYEKLSKYYNGISFLEDYNELDEVQKSFSNKLFKIDSVKEYYSCENQAFRLLNFLGGI
jgi:hypothetical protein